MIRIGISGFGAMGQLHASHLLKGLVPGAQLCAVYDPDAARRKAAGALSAEIACCQTLEELLEKVDAVVLASPHALHVPHALAALQSGRHVLTEKPLGVRASQAQQAVDLAAEKGLVYCVMFDQRALPVCRRVKALLDAGEIGAVRRTVLIQTDCYRPQSYFDSGAWRGTWKLEGGGMLVNQCSHAMDLLCWWLGMPEFVSANVGYGKWHQIEVDADISCFARYPGGGTLHFLASTADVPGINLFEIQGDAGKLAIDRESGALRVYRLDEPEPAFSQSFAGGIGAPGCACEELRFDAAERGHLRVLQNFAAAIAGREKPLAPAVEAMDALRLTQAIYLSSWLGRGVAAPFEDEAFDALFVPRQEQSKPHAAKQVCIDFNAVWKK